MLMKKVIIFIITICSIMLISANAEKYTTFTFPQFSVRLPDTYMTLTKENVESVVGSNSLFSDFQFFLDAFTTDETLYLDAVKTDTIDEVYIKCMPSNDGVDFLIKKEQNVK